MRIDSAGLLYHTADCGVQDGTDDDEDCTCGAHGINRRLVAAARMEVVVEAARKISSGWGHGLDIEGAWCSDKADCSWKKLAIALAAIDAAK